MAFRCEICDEVQPTRTPLNLVVMETRVCNYPPRVYRRNKNKVEDPGGRGTQIVSELKACDDCSKREQK